VLPQAPSSFINAKPRGKAYIQHQSFFRVFTNEHINANISSFPCDFSPHMPLSPGIHSLIMKLTLLVLFVTFAAFAWADYTPQQVHIAVGTQPGDFTFTWSTRSQASAPLVLINNRPMANATAQEFSSGTNTWYIYKTAVSGLTPGNTYSYQIGDRVLGLSSLYSFTVPPQDSLTNYIVIGDLSTSSQYGNPTWQAIGEFIENNPAQAFFHVGDIAYDLCTNEG
jgi:hypothetical protein